MSPRPPLVLIGPTASGKSALAVELATRFGDTEIVSADAMAVYRRMDVGTAKPTVEERAGIAHHLIDEVDPTEDYTVARFTERVSEVIEEIEGRDRSVLVVGGTGLYVRAVVDDFTPPPRYPEIRAELEADPDTAGMYHRLRLADPVAATKILDTNRRRIIRALEVCQGSGQPFSSFGPGVDHYGPTRFRLAGLEIDRELMDARIDRRYDDQLADGFLQEVRNLLGNGLSTTAAQALGYRELAAHLRGECSLEEALEEAKRRTRRFARRQQRWFRRDPRIHWFGATDDELADRLATWWQKPDTEPRC